MSLTLRSRACAGLPSSASLSIILPLVFCLAPVALWSQGQWQGEAVEEEGGTPFSQPFRHRIGDTQGTGGGFGQGDIHDHLWDIFFWTPRIGWACGFGGVFRTEDGGWRWERLKPQGGWYHVQMTGAREVWLLEGFHGQAKAHLWHSVDDGRSWTEVLPEKLMGAHDLVCRGNLRAVLCGDFTSFWSLDGGNSWTPLPFSGTLRMSVPGDVRTSTGFVAYVLGHDERLTGPQLHKSTDSGRTWKEISLPKGLAMAQSIFFSTSERGWIGLSNGGLLMTEDGGDTWQTLSFPERRAIRALWFDELKRGYAAVDNSDLGRLGTALFGTMDGGRSWQAALTGTKNINALTSLGADRVWAAGNVPGYAPNDLVVFFYK